MLPNLDIITEYQDNIFVDESRYYIVPIRHHVGIDEAFKISQIWVEKQNLIFRCQNDFIPSTNLQYFLVRQEHTNLSVGCFGLFAFDQYIEIVNLCLLPSMTGKGLGSRIIFLIERHTKPHDTLAVFTKYSAPWFCKHGFIKQPISTISKSRRKLIPKDRNSVFLTKNKLQLPTNYTTNQFREGLIN